MGLFNNNNNAVMGAQNGNNNDDDRKKRAVAFAKAKRDKAVAFAATGVDIKRLLEAIGGVEDDNDKDC
ncbi:hypothetical protein [Alkalihalobacillus sp. TS-13]|uniref:hypothetical protein n=1 Tax=Alkalihalobacillus sp. TS-13 TaxID=2842455 RepID=UPI001C884B5D|nr:hypothetical protein [Alkalihalobacillus sp. TS-13]